jgi:hypothetical protein
MPLVTIARPAPPAPPIEESAGLAPLFVVLRFLFWTATLKPLLMCLAVTGMCTYWLTNQTIRAGSGTTCAPSGSPAPPGT